MIAVDTSVLVRIVAGDDTEQTETALALLDSEALHVSLLTALEAEWVLRSTYRFTKSETADALRALAALENIHFEQAELLGWAIGRHEAGADFADMLLLVAAKDIGRFATFDRVMARRAGPQAPAVITTLS